MQAKLLTGPKSGDPQDLSPERIDIPFWNVQGATITVGLPVALTTTAASVNGANAVLPATGQVKSTIGVAVRTVPNNTLGLARKTGYHQSIAVYAHGASVTIAVDVAIGPAAGSLGMSSTGLVDVLGPVITLEAAGAAVCSPGGYVRGHIRGL